MPNELPSPAAQAYRDLLQQLDDWFSRATARHPGVIPCRAGCSACCHGPFDISVADALMVKEAVARLGGEVREEVERRAGAQVDLMRELQPEWDTGLGLGGISEEEFDRISIAMADLPCPLLDDAGACRIYADRPMICRMIGLGVVTPTGRVIENACPIAEEFPVYNMLPPEQLDLEGLEELEHACLEAASVELFGTPDQAGYETTIALALTSPFPPR